MLSAVKLALRITTTTFDAELNQLINACLKDLGLAGVDEAEQTDELIIQAVVTYCKMHFGNPDNYDRLKASYDEQKAQLSMASGYTTYEVQG